MGSPFGTCTRLLVTLWVSSVWKISAIIYMTKFNLTNFFPSQQVNINYRNHLKHEKRCNHHVTSIRQRKNLSPRQVSNLSLQFRTPFGCSNHWSTRDSLRSILSSWHAVLRSARISNVESVIYGDKQRMMVTVKLGKEIRKDVILMSQAWDKEKNLSPRQESNLWPSAPRSDSHCHWLNLAINVSTVCISVPSVLNQ